MNAPDIRLGGPADARALLDLQHALDRESDFMLLEPGERESTGSEPSYADVSVLPYARARRTGY
jgi:hypothetical protein